jgi:hypothetical protein
MKIDFHVSKFGIGDAICGLYSACGMASGGHQVALHIRHKPWLGNASFKGVTLADYSEVGVGGFMAYRDELAVCRVDDGSFERRSRASWYTNEVSKALGIKLPPPCRPKITLPKKNELGSGYILLAPFSTDPARNWPASHWRRLAKMLVKQGHKVIAIHSQLTDELVETFKGSGATYYWGADVDWVLSAIAHAAITVGNDSGIVHLAGLLDKPALAILSQMRPEFLFREAPSIRSIVPPTRCAGCHWQAEGGWDNVDCAHHCLALGAITPDAVSDEIARILG